ncbi:hypothetical protein CROQUDRAFT_657891, partial [Cronartium quercuum f. sp. fusiforme G11]
MHTSQSVLKGRLALFLVIIHFLLSVEGCLLPRLWEKGASRISREDVKPDDRTADLHSASTVDRLRPRPNQTYRPNHDIVHPVREKSAVPAHSSTRKIMPNTPIPSPQSGGYPVVLKSVMFPGGEPKLAFPLPPPKKMEQGTTKDQNANKASRRTKEQGHQSTNVINDVDSNETQFEDFTFPVSLGNEKVELAWKFPPIPPEEKNGLDAPKTPVIHQKFSSSGVHSKTVRN